MGYKVYDDRLGTFINPTLGFVPPPKVEEKPVQKEPELRWDQELMKNPYIREALWPLDLARAGMDLAAGLVDFPLSGLRALTALEATGPKPRDVERLVEAPMQPSIIGNVLRAQMGIESKTEGRGYELTPEEKEQRLKATQAFKDKIDRGLQAAQEAMQPPSPPYEPQTAVGRAASEMAGAALEAPAAAVRWVGGALVDLGLSPITTTMITTPAELLLYAFLFKKAGGAFAPKNMRAAELQRFLERAELDPEVQERFKNIMMEVAEERKAELAQAAQAEVAKKVAEQMAEAKKLNAEAKAKQEALAKREIPMRAEGKPLPYEPKPMEPLKAEVPTQLRAIETAKEQPLEEPRILIPPTRLPEAAPPTEILKTTLGKKVSVEPTQPSFVTPPTDISKQPLKAELGVNTALKNLVREASREADPNSPEARTARLKAKIEEMQQKQQELRKAEVERAVRDSDGEYARLLREDLEARSVQKLNKARMKLKASEDLDNVIDKAARARRRKPPEEPVLTVEKAPKARPEPPPEVEEAPKVEAPPKKLYGPKTFGEIRKELASGNVPEPELRLKQLRQIMEDLDPSRFETMSHYRDALDGLEAMAGELTKKIRAKQKAEGEIYVQDGHVVRPDGLPFQTVTAALEWKEKMKIDGVVRKIPGGDGYGIRFRKFTSAETPMLEGASELSHGTNELRKWDPNQLGAFILWDERLPKAVKDLFFSSLNLLNKGLDRLGVYEKTGWWRSDLDGNYYYQIFRGRPEEIKAEFERVKESYYREDGQYHADSVTKVQNIINAPELFETFPDVKDISVRFSYDTSGSDGYYNPALNMITINKGLNIKDAIETFQHELQHVIDKRTRAESGTNINQANKALAIERYRDVITYVKDVAKSNELKNLFIDTLKLDEAKLSHKELVDMQLPLWRSIQRARYLKSLSVDDLRVVKSIEDYIDSVRKSVKFLGHALYMSEPGEVRGRISSYIQQGLTPWEAEAKAYREALFKPDTALMRELTKRTNESSSSSYDVAMLETSKRLVKEKFERFIEKYRRAIVPLADPSQGVYVSTFKALETMRKDVNLAMFDAWDRHRMIETLVKDVQERKRITHVIEGARLELSKNGMAVAEIAKTEVAEARKVLEQLDLMDEFVSNYITHIVTGKLIPGTDKLDPNFLPTESFKRFARQRVRKNGETMLLQELKDKGYLVEEDIAKVLPYYMYAWKKTVAESLFARDIMSQKTPDGRWVVLPKRALKATDIGEYIELKGGALLADWARWGTKKAREHIDLTGRPTLFSDRLFVHKDAYPNLLIAVDQGMYPGILAIARGEVKRFIMANPLIHGTNLESNVMMTMGRKYPERFGYLTSIFKDDRAMIEAQREMVEAGVQLLYPGVDLVRYLRTGEFDFSLEKKTTFAAVKEEPIKALLSPYKTFRDLNDQFLWDKLGRSGQMAVYFGVKNDLLRQFKNEAKDLSQKTLQDIEMRARHGAAIMTNDIFGTIPKTWFTPKWGKFFNALLFARNWNFGLLRTLTGMLPETAQKSKFLPRPLRLDGLDAEQIRLLNKGYGLYMVKGLALYLLTTNMLQNAFMAANGLPPRTTFQNPGVHKLDVYTGEKDAYGKDIYLVSPFFRQMRDYLKTMVEGPLSVGRSKIEALLRTTLEVVFNFDYKGDPIREDGMSFMEQVGSTIVHAGRSLTPIGQFAGREDEIRTLLEVIVPFTGTWVTKGHPAQGHKVISEMLSEYYEYRHAKAYESKEVAKDIELLIMQKRGEEAAALIQKAMVEGTLSAAKLRSLANRLEFPLLSRLIRDGGKVDGTFVSFMLSLEDKEREKYLKAMREVLPGERLGAFSSAFPPGKEKKPLTPPAKVPGREGSPLQKQLGAKKRFSVIE